MRIERLMELEHRRLKQHPAYQKFMETDPEVEKWKGERGPQATAAGLAAAERLKRAGLSKLGAADLIVANEVKLRMASVSSDLCTQMWTGSDQGRRAEVFRALSKLTDDEILNGNAFPSTRRSSRSKPELNRAPWTKTPCGRGSKE